MQIQYNTTVLILALQHIDMVFQLNSHSEQQNRSSLRILFESLNFQQDRRSLLDISCYWIFKESSITHRIVYINTRKQQNILGRNHAVLYSSINTYRKFEKADFAEMKPVRISLLFFLLFWGVFLKQCDCISLVVQESDKEKSLVSTQIRLTLIILTVGRQICENDGQYNEECHNLH